MKRIFYATDGSPHSLAALPVVKALMKEFPEARLTALYVSDGLTHLFGLRADHYLQVEEATASHIRDTIARELSPHLSERMDFLHEYGRPATLICDSAERWKSDIVILGTHGRGMPDRVLVGSVSQEVLRRAEIPVMVVPPAPQTYELRKVLFATDGSSGVYSAEQFVRSLMDAVPHLETLSVYVLNVMTHGPYTGFSESVFERERQRAEAIERDLAERIFAAYGDRHRFYAVEGHPVQSICNVARSAKVDLIVLGSHRHNTMDRWILGSVGEGVARMTPVPAVIVKDPQLRSLFGDAVHDETPLKASRESVTPLS